ncbi:MAG: hypothetical protein ABFQ53_02470, partial [Patescibacteria group bacterium]
MMHFIKKYYKQLSVIAVITIFIMVMFQRAFHAVESIKAEAENLKQVQLDYVQAENFLNKLFEFQRSVEFIDEDTEWMNVLLSDDDD